MRIQTILSVYLILTYLLRATNMFLEYRVPVKQHVKTGSNELKIVFPSTYLKGLEIEEKEGTNKAWNGHSSRVHVRKAQYQYVSIYFSPTS